MQHLDPQWAAYAAREFLSAESALRARYGQEAVYVRPSVWAKDSFMLAVAGWAFLDGDPAIVPAHLDLLVITTGDVSLGRDPAKALRLLEPYAVRHAEPVVHLAVRVPEADKPRLLAELAALPEYAPRFPSRPPRHLEWASQASPERRAQMEQQAAAAKLTRQHRLLPLSVPFHVVNQAMYGAGFRSALTIDELEPDAAIWRPADAGSRGSSPEITYENDPALGIKKLEIVGLAPRDVPGLPFVDPAVIDLAPSLDGATLTRHLAQLQWLTASQPGWSGVPGAVLIRGTVGQNDWYAYDCPPELRRAVDALRGSADPAVAAAATKLLGLWDAQSSILRG